MDIECLDSLTDQQDDAWRAFLAQARHQHPRQGPRFAEVEQAIGKSVVFVIGRQEGAIQAIGLFVFQAARVRRGRIAMASALSGPICDDADTMVAFLKATANHPRFSKVDALCVTPYWLEAEADALSTVFSNAGLKASDPHPFRNTGMIDLTMTENEIRASFSRSARRKVRLVEKSGIEIRRIDNADDAASFFERLNTLVIARHNLTSVSKPEQEAGFRHIYNDPSIGIIFGAFHDGEFLGGLLLYRSGTTAHARRYVADAEAAEAVGNLRVAPALWQEGLFWAKNEGCTHFDVEGFLPLEGKDHPNFNVYEYKREFKPTHVRRVAEHTFVLNPFGHTINALPGRIKSGLKRVFPRIKYLSPKRFLRGRFR